MLCLHFLLCYSPCVHKQVSDCTVASCYLLLCLSANRELTNWKQAISGCCDCSYSAYAGRDQQNLLLAIPTKASTCTCFHCYCNSTINLLHAKVTVLYLGQDCVTLIVTTVHMCLLHPGFWDLCIPWNTLWIPMYCVYMRNCLHLPSYLPEQLSTVVKIVNEDR